MKLLLTLDNDMYYNPNNALSYGCPFILSMGGRGVGKTTGWLIKACQRYNKKGKQFIYIRRYKDELGEFISKDTLGGIAEGIAVKGGAKSATFICGDEVIGYGATLSTYRKFKSSRFPKVTTVIFDEAFLLRSSTAHYSSTEVTDFLEFFNTIQRTRTDIMAVIMGNNLDLFNPYFSYFNVPYLKGGEHWVNRDRGLYVEMPKASEKLIEEIKKTPLYRLTKGTAYGNYYIDNDLLASNTITPVEKPDNIKVFARLVVNGLMLNLYIWNVSGDIQIYCEDRNKVVDDVYTCNLMKNDQPNYLYMNQFKMKLRPMIWHFYFRDKFVYSSQKASDVMKWVIDNC